MHMAADQAPHVRGALHQLEQGGAVLEADPIERGIPDRHGGMVHRQQHRGRRRDLELLRQPLELVAAQPASRAARSMAVQQHQPPGAEGHHRGSDAGPSAHHRAQQGGVIVVAGEQVNGPRPGTQAFAQGHIAAPALVIAEIAAEQQAIHADPLRRQLIQCLPQPLCQGQGGGATGDPGGRVGQEVGVAELKDVHQIG